MSNRRVLWGIVALGLACLAVGLERGRAFHSASDF
jgi:hypothetical protein